MQFDLAILGISHGEAQLSAAYRPMLVRAPQ